MRKLETIQKRENLNIVSAVDEVGPGGANHLYQVAMKTKDGDYDYASYIAFQCGARKDEKSVQGIIDSDLLEIVRDRLKAFQDGPFKSQYNQEALTAIETALYWMNRRVEDRIERNVLGTNQK